MKQLNKEQIQKLVLIAIGALVGIYVLVVYLIGPASADIKKFEKQAEDLTKQIAAAEKEVARIRGGQTQAVQDKEYVQAFESHMPDTLPMAFYPPEIVNVFSESKVTTTQPANFGLQPALSTLGNHYVRHGWLFNINGISYHALGEAQATMENAKPLWEVISLEITAQPQDPTKHNVVVVLGTIGKKGI